MSVTFALFPWAVACLTYLRFRKALYQQRQAEAVPPAAISPLQPFLAFYGLVWAIFISYRKIDQVNGSYIPRIRDIFQT
jgi:amino acid permease